MSLREQRRQATRAAIFEAARSLIEEGGAEALTFRAVAERVGVSVGTVVNHGGTKAHLMVSLLMEEITEAMTRRTDAPSAALLDRVTHRFAPFFLQYAARPSLARQTILEVAFAPDDAFAPYLELTVRFVAELAVWLEAQECLLPKVPPLVAARMLFDTYIGVIVLFLRQEQPDVDAGLATLRGSFEGLMPVLFR